MTTEFDKIRADLAAFADDDEEIVIERNGQCIFVRNGHEYDIGLRAARDGGLLVDYEGETVPYRRFLSHQLANLPVLAERLITKRPPLETYVDSSARLESSTAEGREGRGLELLEHECTHHPPFASRVVFITADAGQGKTALLRQYQHKQAERFMRNSSPFIFWHLDLQGRQLLRLGEALMGDLGDLRVVGLWMPAVITLLQQRVLVLGIDGFDELAAEQGSSDALGALALLVQQMGSQGTIVAASRRTFFDTDRYLHRARLLGRAGATDCEFDQITLNDWSEQDARQYFASIEINSHKFDVPDETYDQVVAELGDPCHPMVTRPFLLAQVARGLLIYGSSPADFVRGMQDPLKGVGSVIQAFVKREVGEKWKQKDTGEPFLTEAQHLELLGDVAEEMFRTQRTTIEIDVLETITTLLLEDWQIPVTQRSQIVEMVRMHVMLTPPDDDYRLRRFDHEQFQYWFTAYALRSKLTGLARNRGDAASTMLSIAHLSDSTAQYVCALIERTFDEVQTILAGFEYLLSREWRPSFLQGNIGTLVPFLLDGVSGEGRLVVPPGAVYSSLVFEGRTLRRVDFTGGTFINVDFTRVDWSDVTFANCEFGEVAFDRESSYQDVVLRDCHIEGIRMMSDDSESREYAPERILRVLTGLGIRVEDSSVTEDIAVEAETATEGDVRKRVRKVLNIFRRTTFMPESTVRLRFHNDAKVVLDEILPMMEQFGIVQTRSWKGSGKQRAWGLLVSLEEIERSDGDSAGAHYDFWQRVDEMDGVLGAA